MTIEPRKIVLELIDGDGDRCVVTCCRDGATVKYDWLVDGLVVRDSCVWSQERREGFRWLTPLIPVIDAAFAELGVKVDG